MKDDVTDCKGGGGREGRIQLEAPSVVFVVLRWAVPVSTYLMRTYLRRPNLFISSEDDAIRPFELPGVEWRQLERADKNSRGAELCLLV